MNRIQVILGSTRTGRFSEMPGRWLAGILDDHPNLEAEIVDLRDYPLDFYDLKVAPGAAGRDYPTQATAAWGGLVDSADGYVLVCPEYNHGYPAVLKNALDHAFVEWRRKPVAFLGYGGVGGARAIEQLRQVAIELDMAPLRAAVHIPPEVMTAARAAAESGDVAPFEPLRPKAVALAENLAWWATALRSARSLR